MENYKLNLESPWEDVKEQIKEVYPELTDEDLHYTPGKDKEFLEALAKKMDKDVPAVKAWIESVSYNNGIAG
jgi:hypothetical protein